MATPNISAQSFAFHAPTPEHVSEVRAIVRKLAKARGDKVSVRMGKGSVKDAIMVSGNPGAADPALRVEICKALLAAGYEHIHAPYRHTIGDELSLAIEHEHAQVSLMVAKLDLAKLHPSITKGSTADFCLNGRPSPLRVTIVSIAHLARGEVIVMNPSGATKSVKITQLSNIEQPTKNWRAVCAKL